MQRTALVTGATAGIGAEFARQLAAEGCSLVLVARSEGPLRSTAEELRRRWGVAVEIVVADLLDDDGLARVQQRLAQTGTPVTILVNNAGHGLVGPFADNTLEDELRHLRIHVEIPLALAHTALVAMRPRGSGTIITVASVAGFVPRGTYGAAKAAMISFSRWANLTYGGEGIRVTAVCPGLVRTEFHQRMGVDTSGVPPLLWLDAAQVVREALRDAAMGRGVSIPSVRYRVLTSLARLAPASIVARLAQRGR